MAQRPREAERFERPVFPAQPVKHKPEAAVSRAALSVTPPFAQPLPVAARRHFRRRPRSSLADRAAPCLFLTPHPRGARPRPSFGPREPRRGRRPGSCRFRRASSSVLVKCAARSGAAWPKCFSSLRTWRRIVRSSASAPGHLWSKYRRVPLHFQHDYFPEMEALQTSCN